MLDLGSGEFLKLQFMNFSTQFLKSPLWQRMLNGYNDTDFLIVFYLDTHIKGILIHKLKLYFKDDDNYDILNTNPLRFDGEDLFGQT